MRTRHAVGFVFALLTTSLLPSSVAEEPKAKPPELTVKLGAIPEVKMGQRPAVDEAQTKRIKGLIADLAKLDSADAGLSATFSGSDFAPVPGQSQVGTLLLTDHQVKKSQTLRDLVALGPDALPHLLDALDDKTPTKIVIKHEFGIGGMWYDSELDFNEVNPAEAAVYKARVEAREKERAKGAKREVFESGVASHTVTVGDVCFVAIGQIVGREYSAVRYQPTACIVINSTTHDAKLCAEVRAAWASKEPAKKLFDSLLADYATESVVNDESPDGWYEGADRQRRAATRLLYYFPKESAKLIAGRLEKLDVGKVDSPIRQMVANGVRTDEFLKAVAWCEEPTVRAAVAGIFERAAQPCDVLAALPAITDAKVIRERLEPMVAKLPDGEGGPFGDGYYLLSALAARTPETAKAVFQKYLKDAGIQRCHTACKVFHGAKVAWDAEVLGPLLEDTRQVGKWSYAVDPEKNDPRLPIRICDEAAVALATHHPELKFTLAGTHADLDKQITVIREQLARKK
jgi:hypothetical protein